MTRKRPAKKKKLEIVFDPQKRKEFLTGFSARKNERKKRAREQLERSLKEEKKNIRHELKEGFKHMKKTYEPLKELTEEDKKEDEYEDDDVKVKIVELTHNDLAKQQNFLGHNQAESSSEDEQPETESEDETTKPNFIPGMDLSTTKKSKNQNESKKRKKDDAAADEDDAASSSKQKKPAFIPDMDKIKSKKDLDKLMKTKSLKKLKQSKAFKMKERFDKKANRKKAQRDKNNMLKSIPKHLRKKKQMQTSRYHKGRLVNKKAIRRRQNND